MAIIADKVPQPPALPAGFKRRVVIKFRSDVQLPYSNAASAEFAKQAGSDWHDLLAAYPGMTLTPYFSTIAEATLRSLTQRAPVPTGFTSYFVMDCPASVDVTAMARAIAALPNVQTAYPEGGPTPPPLDPSNDPRNADQDYLDAAPGGIDARWAWASTDGSGVGFVDLERGWTLNHEDLAAANITLISGVSQDFHGHGTAVLGEVVSADNTLGGVGIAPRCSARVVSQWRTAGIYNTAEAILSAVGVMSAGDVLLLEAQTTHPNATGFVPVEVEQAVFDAIQFATAQGIIVVEAGANGSVDLDAFQDLSGRSILNRGSADFRDSGAIMVGAASSAAPHQRLGFSNFGSRIDCFAWGQNIDTTGDGWTGTALNSYTPSFGGTSGASPIVSGAALLIQSWRLSRGEARLTPAVMRSALSDPALNTASANPAGDRIGVMPNLRSHITRRNRFWWWRYLAWAWLIVIGGLLITPGGVWCIRCGPQAGGYLGDPVVIVLGLVSIVLGVIGLGQVARDVASQGGP